MRLVPVIISVCWFVLFISWKKSGNYEQFQASYPFGRILVVIWIFVWASIFVFVLSPVKPAHIPPFMLKLFGLFTFILALTSMGYGVFWVYREGIKRLRQGK
jgi:hypothetical protein